MECGVNEIQQVSHGPRREQDSVSLECGVNNSTAWLTFAEIVTRGVRRE